MKEFHSKLTVLLIFLIALAFIGLGFTIGIYNFPEDMYYWPAIAGLPVPAPLP